MAIKGQRRKKVQWEESKNSSLLGRDTKLQFILTLLRWKSYLIDYQFITEKEVKS